MSSAVCHLRIGRIAQSMYAIEAAHDELSAFGCRTRHLKADRSSSKQNYKQAKEPPEESGQAGHTWVAAEAYNTELDLMPIDL